MNTADHAPLIDHLRQLVVSASTRGDPLFLGKHPKYLWDTVTVQNHPVGEALALCFLSPGFSNDPRQEAQLQINNAEFGGVFKGALDYPKMLDVTGIDVFLPSGLGFDAIKELMVELRVGETTYYESPAIMMSIDMNRKCSDEFPIFVHIPTMQNVSVVMSCKKTGVDWNGARFGVRLRGVGYREVV